MADIEDSTIEISNLVSIRVNDYDHPNDQRYIGTSIAMSLIYITEKLKGISFQLTQLNENIEKIYHKGDNNV